MYQALYRTYRPETFEAMLGQEHIIKILKNQISTDTVSHAYLFCGTRGTGKTTTARILAKGVNCTGESERPCGVCDNCRAIRDGVFMDVIEIDAASNNGVENIRELRESVKYPPAAGKKKVYIVDEVHMLSSGAFNALLKTLEEPPENVMFILATTEVQKLPATILSRCMRLDFKRVPESVIQEGMAEICRQKEIEIEQGALKLIAANADGSVRDGLSILDQCLSGGDKQITRNNVLEFLGATGEEVFLELTGAIMAGNVPDALLLLDRVLADGKDVRQFMRDWLSHYRGLLITKFIKEPDDILNMSCENVERIREQAQRLDVSEIDDAIVELSRTMSEAKWSTQPRILLELCAVKLGTGIGSAQTVSRQRAAKPERPQNRTPDAPCESAAAGRTGETAAEPFLKPGDVPADRKAQPESVKDVNLDALWHAIFEDGEAMKGSFNLIRSGTRLLSLAATEFVVAASSEIKIKYLKDNSRALEDLMEKRTGQRRRLECRLEDDGESLAEKSVEELAATVESAFGINIEIE